MNLKEPKEKRTRWRKVAMMTIALLAQSWLPGVLRAEDKVDEAMARATQYLMSTQDPATGGIHNKMRHETAMTSLAILAMAACGHQPADPTPEGESMRKALAFVLRPEAQGKDGYFGDTDGSRMYGHGITTLMLSEMLGMGGDAAQDEVIRTKCRLAIDLILRSQKVSKNDSNRGGWRYSPDSGDSDMSVTVWQTMALRAAKNSGLDVPREAIDDAVGYIRRLYAPDTEARGATKLGGFGYQTKGREISTTAEGLLAMQVCGQYDTDEVKGASDRLLKDGVRQGERWFFYTTYYYAQGMYQRGGKHADEAKRLVSELLLPLQSREGWWEGINGEERQGGKVYATAMAVLSLSVKNHFLPIYQR
ncbi:MAG TPA: prenyltransferase/squalene oxidase repeat-containing protein [Chthoniobacter sp.]|nr:prenyltransferase/squalene oxidase repeat-containing protein [Chthoniobacter sp.]